MTTRHSTSRQQYVVDIDDADPSDVALLGGKGAGLAEMADLGLPVPPAFIITTDACRYYLEHGTLPDGLLGQVDARMRMLERKTRKVFGAGPAPLLVSVRSGAPISMPGMMDTILNLGLNRSAAIAIGDATGSPAFVADLVRRFQSMYSQTVLGALDEPVGVSTVIEGLSADESLGSVFDIVWAASEEAVSEEVGSAVPSDPQDQLRGAIEAVFRSWNTRRARTYRDHHRIRHDLGTAVVVQAMVFGNLGPTSGSGVAFTRNPVDGSPALYGEFLYGGQGEDVVSGSHTPESIDIAAKRLPRPFEELERLSRSLEASRGDVLDIEFTIEGGRLYLLQVRSAKRTAEAAIRIADDLWSEGVAPSAAISKVTADHVRQAMRPSFDAAALEEARASGRVLATGTGACPGQVSGEVCFDSDTAQQWAAEGRDVILVRPVTSPSDLHGMIASRGILTAVGGSTSHAAVVARALGTTCVVGCSSVDIDVEAKTLTSGALTIAAGDRVSLDGSSGEFFAGEIPLGTAAGRTSSFTQLLERCDEVSATKVWGRVTLPDHVDRVRDSGGAGVVLAIDDVMAASGRAGELVDILLGEGELTSQRLADITTLVTEEVQPLLAAAGSLPVSIRAIDLLVDESREFVHQSSLLAVHPELTFPLGVPGLVEAQWRGVAAAMAALNGACSPTTLAVRHIASVAEATELAALDARLQAELPDVSLSMGIYLTSAVGLTRVEGLRKQVPVSWIELRTLQAAHHELPARMLLTREPLDSYLQAGLLPADPRRHVDDLMAGLLSPPAAESGLRLSLPVDEELIAATHELGFRSYAVDVDEVASALLCLAKAALAQ